MAGVVIANERDAREFVEAKRRKREPIRIYGDGAAEAVYLPTSAADFARFRGALRETADWGRASEGIDALEFELGARRQLGMPTPNKVIQNEDSSLSLFWKSGEASAMARFFVDGVFTMIGGADGPKARGVTPEFVDALAMIARMKAA